MRRSATTVNQGRKPTRLTSEQRKEMARTWTKCHVPVSDITRLLEISEEELDMILREHPETEGDEQ